MTLSKRIASPLLACTFFTACAVSDPMKGVVREPAGAAPESSFILTPGGERHSDSTIADLADSANTTDAGSAKARNGAATGTPAEDERAIQTTTQQQHSEPKSARKGEWELTVQGVGGNDETFDVGGGQIEVAGGYYLTDTLELGLRQNMSYSDTGGGSGSHAWNGISRLFFDVHFGQSALRPYIGVNGGFVYGDTVKETLIVGPEAGLKIYLRDKAFLQIHAEYEFFVDSNETISNNFETGQYVYAIGIGLNF